jgi:hypothetical protein
MFGVLFGSRDNAPVYLAGIIGFVALLGAIAIGIWGTGAERGDLIKSLVAIVVAALSFIGGASGAPAASPSVGFVNSNIAYAS